MLALSSVECLLQGLELLIALSERCLQEENVLTHQADSWLVCSSTVSSLTNSVIVGSGRGPGAGMAQSIDLSI